MTAQVQFGPWRLECDAAATRTAYDAIARGGPDECTCNGCRNWVALRPEIYTPPLRVLLRSVGIVPEKEVETYHISPDKSGLHMYGGWWHCVGTIVRDVGGWWSPPGVGLRLKVFEDDAMRADAFGDHPLLQIELQAEIRWALDEPEPEL